MEVENVYEAALAVIKSQRQLSYEELMFQCNSEMDVFVRVVEKIKEEDTVITDNRGFVRTVEWPIMDYWPLAYDPALAVKTREDRRLLGRQICDKLGINNDQSFLDFGCGDGDTAIEAANFARLSIGYDIKAPESHNDVVLTGEMKVVEKYGPFDVILLWDVLDHLVGDPVEELNKIKRLLSPNGRIYIRCHPWTSKNGGHCSLNKAYIHLLFDESNPADDVTRTLNPLEDYRGWFESSNLKIVEEDIIRDKVDPFFENKEIWKQICSNWEHETVGFYNPIQNRTKYNCGDTLDFRDACVHNTRLVKVGSYQPNGFGLYDMHGNVWEWCHDNYGPGRNSDGSCHVNAELFREQSAHVLRGGGFFDIGDICYSSARPHCRGPNSCSFDTGFRVVMAAGNPLLNLGNGYKNSLGMEFVLIPPGDFIMGAECDKISLPQTHMSITHPFYMGVHTVTQKQYSEIASLESLSPERFSPDVTTGDKHRLSGFRREEMLNDNFPIVGVSWSAASEFCKKIGQKDGNMYRLPSEAEWEYCCGGICNNSLMNILGIQFVDYVCCY
jgi:formylglycine-generating enzyme required for sulfatase activity/2-polyprenyl-3-methyl-5-hydroxy-6-metoxy-1,4-benzoquinol methylase